MKETASVFRLKRDNRNLPTEEYVDNLCHYLSDSRRKTTFVVCCRSKSCAHCLGLHKSYYGGGGGGGGGDDEIMDQIEVNEESVVEDVEFTTGDHVIAVWLDDDDDDDGGKENWHLGVVDSYDGKYVAVAYFARSGTKKNKLWIFPEETKLQSISPAQIIARGIHVAYRCSTRIRCDNLNAELVKELDGVINERNANLTG